MKFNAHASSSRIFLKSNNTMKIRTTLSSLCLLAMGGLFFASCTQETATTNTVGTPSNVMALSKSANTISIKWTRGSGDTGPDTIIVANGTSTSNVVTTSTATQTDLTVSPGVVSTITVASTGGRSSSISWMPAVRTNDVQIFEFSSSGSSGLQLNGPNGQARTVSMNLNTNPNAQGEVDFLLDDAQRDNGITTPSGLSFEGAQVFDQTWRNSYIANDQNYIAGGLDSFYSATDFSSFLSTASTQHNSYDIPNSPENDRVLTVVTQDGNLAKIDIKPDPTTGLLYSGSGTDRYITVDVSYQPVAHQPYAARPAHHYYPSGHAPRLSVQ